MKLLLSNQNIFQKLQRNLNGCLKSFNDLYKDLDENERQNLIKQNNVLFNHRSNQSDMFSAQIQSFDIPNKIVSITDGIIKYTVFLRDVSVFERANFFDTPHNSLVIIRRWSYEIVYIQNTFQINLIIDEMKCIDIITTIFYCQIEVNFTQGYKGISKSTCLSALIHDYSMIYFKAIQLLKQFLIHDTFLSDFYNSTRTKSQPKLLILSTIRPKFQANQDDFAEEGCLLRQVKLSQSATISSKDQFRCPTKNKQDANQVYLKKRNITQKQESIPIVTLERQQKYYFQENQGDIQNDCLMPKQVIIQNQDQLVNEKCEMKQVSLPHNRVIENNLDMCSDIHNENNLYQVMTTQQTNQLQGSENTAQIQYFQSDKQEIDHVLDIQNQNHPDNPFQTSDIIQLNQQINTVSENQENKLQFSVPNQKIKLLNPLTKDQQNNSQIFLFASQTNFSSQSEQKKNNLNYFQSSESKQQSQENRSQEDVLEQKVEVIRLKKSQLNKIYQ